MMEIVKTVANKQIEDWRNNYAKTGKQMDLIKETSLL